jgi:hypothetical protein
MEPSWSYPIPMAMQPTVRTSSATVQAPVTGRRSPQFKVQEPPVTASKQPGAPVENQSGPDKSPASR